MASISVRVEGPDQVGEARRAAAGVAAGLQLDETTAGRLAIVVTECGNNLWKHAGGGQIVLTPTGSEETGVEVLALDRGPGMRDVERCFQDGYSTAGSPGTGLGAVRRLSSHHDVYTVPDQGTALLARVARPGSKTPPLVAGVSVPAPGESVCGDDFAFAQRAGGTAVLVVDGLGHGPLAADCATAAVDAFRENGGGSPPDAMRDIHGALRGTRGAAVAVGTIDWVHGEMRYCGIGNIAGMIWEHSRPRHLLSHPGIVGHDLRNVKDITYRLGENVLVLLYSDGISTHWSLDSYAGLHLHDPALIAGVIYRDHRRGRDDATVVVAKRPVES